MAPRFFNEGDDLGLTFLTVISFSLGMALVENGHPVWFSTTSQFRTAERI